MIAQLLILAAAVLPPQGPLRWRGEEIRLNPPARYFRIVPMKEPEPVKEEARPYFGNDPDELVRRFAANPDPAAAFAVLRALASADFADEVSRPPTNRFAAVTASERAYLLRFAASKGDRDAQEFFDENGDLLAGREYDYVYARHRHAYSRRRLPGGGEPGSPGCGCAAENPIRPYSAGAELRKLLDQYALKAHWFYQTTNNALPFFEFTPKDCPTNEVPLVVYVPGSGEQGTNLIVQFNQRACLEKVVSAEFQRRHPCRFLIVCLPEKANCNSGLGYPEMLDSRSELYGDLILAYAKNAENPKVDARRIYLTGLGSGAVIAAGMALDHPGRFAAVAPVWFVPHGSVVHPRQPGNWRCYNIVNPEFPDPGDSVRYMQWALRTRNEFTANVIAGGGECSFQHVPKDTPWPWWNLVWSGDEIYDWLFGHSLDGPLGGCRETDAE